MSRKTDMINAHAEGKPLAPVVKEEELDELDKHEVQEEILQPTSAEITLIDGEKFFLPYEFSLKDIFRNKVMLTLRYFYMLLQSELKNIRGDQEIAATDPLVIGILFKPTIQTALAEMLATVTGKPLSHFRDKLDGTATVEVFSWLIRALTNATKGAGETDSKNA